MSSLRIRPLRTMEELAHAVKLQQETWGPRFDDVVSAALMLVAQKIGGIAAGAFLDDNPPPREPIGILFGLSGFRDDERIHWSHMLAIAPPHQGRGIGRLMKLYQRARARALGIRRIYWTFDPLEARNAHFNLNVLRVTVDEYVPDMYGSGESSPLHRGIGTDRFVVRWDVSGDEDESGDVDGARSDAQILTWQGDEATADLTKAPRPEPASIRAGAPSGAERTEIPPGAEHTEIPPGGEGTEIPPGSERIEIPPDIQRLKASNPDEAMQWRTATRAAFVHHLHQGRRIAGFTRDPRTGSFYYIVAPA